MKDGSENHKKKYEDYWTRSCFSIEINYLKRNLILCYNKKILKSKAITQLSGMMNKRIDIPLNDKYLTLDLLKQAFAKSRMVTLDLGCGVGKTHATIELINDYLQEHPDHKILWMTCRIALTEEQRSRLGEKWVYYLDLDSKEHSGEETKPVYQYLACSVTSLSTYIDPNVMYDLVIVDECETLLASFGGDAKCHNDIALLNWNYLTKLMQQSKMIWMDAFTTKITLDTIGAVCSEKEYCIIGKPSVPKTRKLVILEGLVELTNKKIKRQTNPWWQQLFKSLDAGEKVFIAVGPKGLNKPGSDETKESVEALLTILVNKYGFKRGKELLAYHSLTKAEKKKLVNINPLWGSEELRVVIGNACLASCMSTRDILQLIQRVRHPLHPDVVMYIKKGYSDATVRKRDAYLEAMRKINYNGIGKLAENLLIESRATLSDIHRSLKLFAQKTSFKVEFDKTVFCSKEMDLIQSCMSTDGHAFHWSNIKSITPTEHARIRRIKDRGDCDMDEYLQWMKYNFKELFLPDTEEDVMEEQWDEHRLTTVAMHQIGMIRAFGEDTHGVTHAARIINRILEENSIDLEEDDFEITKCSVPFSEIKEAFDIRRTPTTFRQNLFATIFNTFFHDNVYQKNIHTWIVGRLSVKPSTLASFSPYRYFLEDDDDDC
ncbi:hypothetical protein HK104_000852 [Borealophlyctis nickersoniae]|nr:hypothetical protein HK104_000852 [Borealophlyctis nickersoniae]